MTQPNALAGAKLAIYDAVAGRNFGKRETLVLNLILQVAVKQASSIDFQEPDPAWLCAEIPRLALFAQGCRISMGNASAALAGLKRKLVILERETGRYTFRLPFSAWLVEKRIELGEVFSQLSLIPTEPDLQDALRHNLLSPTPGDQVAGDPSRPHAHAVGRIRELALSAIQAPAASQAAGQISVVREPGTAAQAFPESGTPRGRMYPNWESLDPADKGGPGRALPESGTPFKALKSSVVKSIKTTETVKTLKPRPLTPRENRLRSDVLAYIGDTAAANWGGFWTNQIRADYDLVERVMADTRNEEREGTAIQSRGGRMAAKLKYFASHSP